MINHLAVIMDGNRRWAKNHSLQPWLGHKEGIKPINEVINFCLDNQINYLKKSSNIKLQTPINFLT